MIADQPMAGPPNARTTFRGSRVIRVPLPPDRAMVLFTARGERMWVPDWDPEFPAGEPPPGEDEHVGMVFVTEADGHATYWVVTVRGPDHVRYARTTPGRWAGTVGVRLAGASARGTDVAVTYELTALTGEAAVELARFADGFDAAIGGWERLIADAVARR